MTWYVMLILIDVFVYLQHLESITMECSKKKPTMELGFMVPSLFDLISKVDLNG